MDMNLKVKARMDGKMDSGDHFCYKNEIYEAVILKGDAEDDYEDFYYVIDEDIDINTICKFRKIENQPHGMDEDFFNEYFEIIENNS